MKRAGVAFSILMTVGCLSAADITGLKIVQNWPWDCTIYADFTLTGADASDVEVNVGKGGTDCGTRMPPAFESLAPGHHRIALDLSAFGIEGQGSYEQLRVTLTPVVGAEFMVVDMSDPENFDISYLAEPPAGGFFTTSKKDAFKTTKIAFRRVRAGTFLMGSPADEPGHLEKTDYTNYAYLETQHEVQLTNDFYLALTPLTYTQVTNICPALADTVKFYSNPSYPAYDFSRQHLVGADYIIKSGQTKVGWPTETACGEDSLIGQLQRRAPAAKLPSGMEFFLPTEAEWEYACRAGTEGPFNDGSAFSTNSTGRSTALDKLGTYRRWGDANRDAPFKDAANPDDFKPNAWGFYGFHGNVWEHCADIGNSDMSNLKTAKKIEPVGFANTSSSYNYSVCRGGSCNSQAWQCRSACRSMKAKHTAVHSRSGVRLAVVVKRVK